MAVLYFVGSVPPVVVFLTSDILRSPKTLLGITKGGGTAPHACELTCWPGETSLGFSIGETYGPLTELEDI